MKYIRTKDEIYEINWFDADNFGDEKGDIHSNCEIINEADTIEELCDEFVFEETYPSGLKRHIITEDVAVGTQFGAIWTDKGLIYVAKMNDNGELELL